MTNSEITLLVLQLFFGVAGLFCIVTALFLGLRWIQDKMNASDDWRND